MRSMKSYAVIAAALTTLTACESLWLGTAGEMRVEVELYKGPLSQSRAIQVGELQAVIADATAAMYAWQEAASQVACVTQPEFGTVAKKCVVKQTCVSDNGAASCQSLAGTVNSARATVHDLCRIHINPLRIGKEHEDDNAFKKRRAVDSSFDERKHYCSGVVDEEKKYLDVNADYETALAALSGMEDDEDEAAKTQRLLASIAGSLKSKAFITGFSFNDNVPKLGPVRSLIIDFAVIAAEFSNQIQSRNAVLAKQVADPERKTNRFSMTDHLRDASSTDFLKLYDWYEGTLINEPPYYIGQTPLDVASRVRASERLFRDYYWEKINEVYASGLGKSQMAFIKNDVGNWELKSFSSDPTELLNAYANAADAIIKTVAKVAAGGGTEGLGKAARLADFANVLSTGQTAAASAGSGKEIAAIHERTKTRLETEKASFIKREEKIGTDIEAQRVKTTAAADKKKAEKDKVDDLTATIGTLQETIDKPETCANSAEECDERTAAKNEKAAKEGELKKAETARAAADKAYEEENAKLAELEASKTALRKTALATIGSILEDHQTVITALQEAATPAPSPVSSTSTLNTVPSPPS